MDQTIYNEIFNEPKWHRIIDIIAVLFIGLLAGATVMYAITFYNADNTIIVPVMKSEVLPSGIKVEEA